MAPAGKVKQTLALNELQHQAGYAELQGDDAQASESVVLPNPLGLHARPAARDAKHLVNHRVIVRIGEDAVAPDIAPAIAAEDGLVLLFRQLAERRLAEVVDEDIVRAADPQPGGADLVKRGGVAFGQ